MNRPVIYTIQVAASLSMLAAVFSKGLGIPETLSSALMILSVLGIWWSYRRIQKAAQAAPRTSEAPDASQRRRRRLIWIGAGIVILNLLSPFWFPWTGSRFGFWENEAIGTLSSLFAIGCLWLGNRLREKKKPVTPRGITDFSDSGSA